MRSSRTWQRLDTDLWMSGAMQISCGLAGFSGHYTTALVRLCRKLGVGIGSQGRGWLGVGVGLREMIGIESYLFGLLPLHTHHALGCAVRSTCRCT